MIWEKVAFKSDFGDAYEVMEMAEEAKDMETVRSIVVRVKYSIEK